MKQVIDIATPPLGLFIGYSGENGYRTFEFDVTKWKLDYPAGLVSIAFRRPDMTAAYPVVTNSPSSKVSWIITSAEVDVSGTGEVILEIKQDNVVGKNASIPTRAIISADFSGTAPDPLPDWLTSVLSAEAKTAADVATVNQVKTDVQTLANAAQVFADNAYTYSTNAGVSATDALASKNTTLQAKIDVETYKTDTETAKLATQQALSDLLTMLGTDIPTLVDGKVPMSQIPATATQEIYVVSSETELAGLTAQRGDLAELVEQVDHVQTVTKTWQLLGDDPTIFSNWVVWGTSYAVQAGNATTAQEAENASMINDHRMVEMTAEEFESAVKDEGTYYLVYPEAE